jgi:2-keto-4-pentenoate hydratase/2-oxohepta-3-ene-1,7-dioic acid hydratase in catechol pathway
VIGPGESIVLPKVSKAPDYEAEFAFVIGTGGRNIAAEDWRKHVFGYTIVNDVSARDYQRATSQWLMGKTFDTFAPLGPWIVSADEIEDPHSLDISMVINGEILQNSFRFSAASSRSSPATSSLPVLPGASASRANRHGI